MLLIVEILFIILISTVLFMLYKSERALTKRIAPQARIEEYWDGRERRRYVRFKKTLDATYTIERRPHIKNNARTVDISEGGMKLLLEEKLSKGTYLALQLALPDSKNSIDIEGEVVWSGEVEEADLSGKRFFHAGIRFVAIKEPQGLELSNYMRSLYKEIAL